MKFTFDVAKGFFATSVLIAIAHSINNYFTSDIRKEVAILKVEQKDFKKKNKGLDAKRTLLVKNFNKIKEKKNNLRKKDYTSYEDLVHEAKKKLEEANRTYKVPLQEAAEMLCTLKNIDHDVSFSQEVVNSLKKEFTSQENSQKGKLKKSKSSKKRRSNLSRAFLDISPVEHRLLALEASVQKMRNQEFVSKGKKEVSVKYTKHKSNCIGYLNSLFKYGMRFSPEVVAFFDLPKNYTKQDNKQQ